MNCVLHPLPCPVYADECDRDGECYVWRCENPRAPKHEPDAAPVAATPCSSPRAQQQPATAAAVTDDMHAELVELFLRITAARRVS